MAKKHSTESEASGQEEKQPTVSERLAEMAEGFRVLAREIRESRGFPTEQDTGEEEEYDEDEEDEEDEKDEDGSYEQDEDEDGEDEEDEYGEAGQAQSGLRRRRAPKRSTFELMCAGGPFEEVLICRSLGLAHIHLKDENLYIVPNGRLHRINGAEVGWYSGVFRSKIANDFTRFPPSPSEPYDAPSSINNKYILKMMNPTKAMWRFREGTIYAVGPANSYVIPLKGDPEAPQDGQGGFQLVISIAMVITGGTGRYENARGTVTSLGATWFPYIPGLALDTTGALKHHAMFEARGVHCFRITRQDYRQMAAAAAE